MTNPWLSRFASTPVLLAPERVDEFTMNLEALGAEPLLAEAMAAGNGASDSFWTELGPRLTPMLRPYVVDNGVLAIPVRGVLLNDFPYQFGAYATGYGYLCKALDRGLADPDVKGIAFVINSPGGEVAGNFDLVDDIFAARGQKPMRAFAAETACSGAYSIASAADSLTVSRTGSIGSIGVMTAHLDVSQALEGAGLKYTLIFAGAHKADGSSYAPLPDAVRARIQERVDAIYQMFVTIVARNRGLGEPAVRATEALVYMAAEAIANGLADKVGSLDGALAEFSADVNNPTEGDETMETKPTLASIRADSPDIARALIEEGRAAAAAETATTAEATTRTAVTSALTADRERMAALDTLLVKSGPGAKDIIAKAKADGTSAAAAALAIMTAGAHLPGAALAALAADETVAATGATPALVGTGTGKNTVAQTPEGWKAEWAASAVLTAEFVTADDYAAVRAAESRGAVRVLHDRKAAA